MANYRNTKRQQTWREKRSQVIVYKKLARVLFAYLKTALVWIFLTLITIAKFLYSAAKVFFKTARPLIVKAVIVLKKISLKGRDELASAFSKIDRPRFKFKLSLSTFRVLMPKQKTWRPLLAASLLIIFVVYAVFQGSFRADAATYSWQQSSWSGGVSADSFGHENDRTGVDVYADKSGGIEAGDDLHLISTSTVITDTNDLEFKAGDISDVNITGVGDNSSLYLKAGQPTYTDWRNEARGVLDLGATGAASGILFGANNIAFVYHGNNFYSIDVSNKDNPLILNTLSGGSNFSNMVAYGSYIYATQGTHMRVIDVSNPSSIFIHGSVAISEAYSMVAQGHYLYLAQSTGLSIYDVSNGGSPILSGNLLGYNLGYRDGMVIKDNFVYVYGFVSSQRYLYSVDVRDKSAPFVVYSNVSNIGVHLEIVDGYLYNVNNQNLAVFRLNVDGSFTWLSNSHGAPVGRGVRYHENRVYVHGPYGIRIFDISNRESPRLLQATSLMGNVEDVAFNDGYIIVADKSFGLRIFNNTNTKSVQVAGGNGNYLYSGISDAHIVDNVMYAMHGSFLTFDISNPAAPVELDKFSAFGSFFVHQDDVIYIATTGGLKSLDVSNPRDILLLDDLSIGTTQPDRALAVHGDYVYLADNTNIKIIDISDPSDLVEVGTYPLGMKTYDIKIADGVLYSAQTYRILSLDLHNPAAPSLIQEKVVPYSRMIEIFDNILYSIRSSDGITSYNIEDESNWIELGYFKSYGSDNTRVLRRSGDLLFYLESAEGISVLDASNPASLTRIALFGFKNFPREFQLIGNNLVLFNGSSLGISTYTLNTYAPSSSFESQVFDVPNLSFSQINWDAAIHAGTEVGVKVRTANNPEMNGAAAWSDCNALTEGGEISDSLCVINSQRYLQYQVSLSTSDPMATPTLHSVSFGYTSYNPGELTSVPYDSNSDENLIAGLSWLEPEEVPAGSGVVISLRSGASLSALTDAPWVEVASSTAAGLSAGCLKTAGEVTCGQDALPESMRDGAADRWFQYKINLLSTSYSTSWLDDFAIAYVVNAPPEIEFFTAQQGADGNVTLSYSVRDSDTGEGTNTPGEITPSFEYWDGDAWQSCTTFVSPLANVDVESLDYTNYSATWLAKADLDALYSANFLVRLKINDNEVANNITYLTADAFSLDLSEPAFTAFSVDGRDDATSNINLVVNDDSMSGVMIKMSNRSDLTSDGINDNSGEWLSYNTHFIWELDPSHQVVYYQAKDGFNNISNGGTAQSVTIPSAPANILFQDISNLETEEWREFIAWGQSSLTDDNFGSYRVYRSVDNSSFEQIGETDDRLKNFFIDYNLDKDANYSYKATVVDTSGNISSYSAVVTDRPDGQGGSDLTPPSISKVTVEEVGTQSARISWQTDEPSDSIIDYLSTAGGDFSLAHSRGLTSMSDNEESLGEHSVVLDGLSPDTTYYFQVRSRDPRGNEGLSRPEPDSYSFKTTAGPVISDVTITKLSNIRAEIAWLTDVAAESFVYYTDDLSTGTFQRAGNASAVTEHLVAIEGLTMGKAYYFYVQSGAGEDKNVKDGQINYYYFTTGADTQPPIVYFDQASDVSIADESAVVRWRTSEPARTTLHYGESEEYSETLTNNNFNTDHSFTLSDLKKGTSYYLEVNNTDENQNTAAPLSFIISTTDSTDITPPNISDILVKAIYDSSAVISFTTNEAAFAQIEYGNTSGDYNLSTPLSAQNYNHSFVISDLNPETTYYYSISVKDANDNESISEEGSFATLKTLVDADDANAREEAAKKAAAGGGVLIVDKSDKVAPVISAVNVAATASGLAVSWLTDEEADAFIEYGLSLGYGKVAGSRAKRLQHSYDLTDLEPGVKYFIRITSSDSAGNISEPYEETIITREWDEGVDELSNLADEIMPDGEELSSEEAAANDGKFLSVLNKTIDLIKNAAKYVSISVLEASLNEQQRMISELASLTPAPALVGEPRVQVWEDMAVISWQTDKKASSLLSVSEDATELNNGSIIGNPNIYNTEHRVVVTGLAPNISYSYKLQGATPVGALLQSVTRVFETSIKSAKVENYTVNKRDDQNASFRWLSSVPTDTSVRVTPYRNDQLISTETRIFNDKNVSTLHEMTVSTFEPGVFYRVELFGRDAKGGIVSQTVDPFYTSDQELSFEISQVRVDSALSLVGSTKVQTIISWHTTRPAISRIYYRRAGEQNSEEWSGETKLEESHSKNHMTVITDFEPGVAYQFQIVSQDSSGKEIYSKTYSTLTPRQKESVFQIIVNNIEETFGWVNTIN